MTFKKFPEFTISAVKKIRMWNMFQGVLYNINTCIDLPNESHLYQETKNTITSSASYKGFC